MTHHIFAHFIPLTRRSNKWVTIYYPPYFSSILGTSTLVLMQTGGALYVTHHIYEHEGLLTNEYKHMGTNTGPIKCTPSIIHFTSAYEHVGSNMSKWVTIYCPLYLYSHGYSFTSRYAHVGNDTWLTMIRAALAHYLAHTKIRVIKYNPPCLCI